MDGSRERPGHNGPAGELASAWAIITANFGHYDPVRRPPGDTNVDRVMVTDSRSVARAAERKGWRVIISPESSDPWLASREPKFAPYEFTQRSNSIWVDGRSVFDRPGIVDWAAAAIGNGEVGAFRHPGRTNILDEAKECRSLGLATDDILDQVETYSSDGFPITSVPLVAGMLLIRRHTPRVLQFGEIWRSETHRWRTRDQISLPYAIWRSSVNVSYLIGSPYRLQHVTFGPHRRRRVNERSGAVVAQRVRFTIGRAVGRFRGQE